MKVEVHYWPLGKGVENCKQYEKPIELYNLSTDEGEQNNMAIK